MSRKAGKPAVARERLQPLTSEELAQVTGGNCVPFVFTFDHYRRNHRHHHHHHHHFVFMGCGPQSPFPPFGTGGFPPI